jgi:hypothetical protein
MMNLKRFLLNCCILLIFSVKLFSQDVLDYSNSLKYANYLFQTKQYRFSAVEYERVTFLEPSDTLAKLKLIQSYRLINKFNEADARLEKFFPEMNPDYPEKFAVEKFKLLFLEHRYTEASSFLLQNKTIDLSKNTEYKLGSLLMQNKWMETKTMAENYLIDHNSTPIFDSLYNISLQGLNIRYKSPVCAALMSTIIPGSGKVYTKQYKDGIYAFLIISAFSYLTYNSIHHDGFNAGSILYGSIALSFYSANIYGSFKSAIHYNQKKNKLLSSNIESIILNQ